MQNLETISVYDFFKRFLDDEATNPSILRGSVGQMGNTALIVAVSM
jgi:hypothetical protein